MTMGSMESSPEGASSVSSGAANQVQDTQTQETKNTVAYETHRRLLDEKKKLQEKFEALAAEKSERERRELEAKGEYQKLIELERKKAAEAEVKLAELENTFLQGKKAKAFLTALGSNLDEKFFDFMPLERIVVDPETKEVNMTSVAEAAEMFRKTYPELLKPRNAVTLPNAAPMGNGFSTIARSEWLKLPAKEMLKYKPSQIIG